MVRDLETPILLAYNLKLKEKLLAWAPVVILFLSRNAIQGG